MKNSQLIAALQKLDPEAEVQINIMQQNKAYGVLQLGVQSTLEKSGHETWVSGNYRGCTITVHLPEKHFITKRK